MKKKSAKRNLIRSIGSKVKRGEVVRKSLEEGWQEISTLSSGIPEYNSESDPNCPKASMRKFNTDNKKTAEAKAKAKSSSWMETALKSSFSDIPIKMTPSLREKASLMANQDSMAEVEILQKVIVRENLLDELRKLVDNQNDIESVYSEVSELIKAVRFQTVEVIGDIEVWTHTQKVQRPFLYRGENYLTKAYYDVAFLDAFPILAELFGFSFSDNPLMYNKDMVGDTRAGFDENPFRHEQEEADRRGRFGVALDGQVEGVEVLQLLHIEGLIRREFERAAEGRRQVLPTAAQVGMDLTQPGLSRDALESLGSWDRPPQRARASAEAEEGGGAGGGGGYGGLHTGGRLENSVFSADPGQPYLGPSASTVPVPAPARSARRPAPQQRQAQARGAPRQPHLPPLRLGGGVDAGGGSSVVVEPLTHSPPKPASQRGSFGLGRKDTATISGGKRWGKTYSEIKVWRERMVVLAEETDELKVRVVVHQCGSQFTSTVPALLCSALLCSALLGSARLSNCSALTMTT
jgi:hypothetical protein